MRLKQVTWLEQFTLRAAPSTIGRILDLFPEEMHGAIRSAMAMNMPSSPVFPPPLPKAWVESQHAR